MATLGPGIGKGRVKRLNGFRREQKPHGVGNFDIQNANVFQRGRFSAGFLDAPDHFVDAEKISLGTGLCEFTQKAPVAAAKIDLERRRASEDGEQIERSQVCRRDQFDHGKKITRGKVGFNPGARRTPDFCTQTLFGVRTVNAVIG
jgi:hypothetical protein